MSEERCPVCKGRGYMPAGFYTPGVTTAETCRSCGGRTIVEAGRQDAGPVDDPMDLTDFPS